MGQRLLFITLAFLAGALVGLVTVLLDTDTIVTVIAFLVIVGGIFLLGEQRLDRD